MLNFVLETFLLVVLMLVAVPALTGGAVAVPSGGFFRGLAAVIVIGLMNKLLWLLIAVLSLGGAILTDYLTFGLVALLINALAFLVTARLCPNVLYVRSYWSALCAALITTLAFAAIHYYLPGLAAAA